MVRCLMLRNGFKGIYQGKEFTLGLAVEFGTVMLLSLVGYIICTIITGW
jgi:hypothetical protein